MDLPTFLDFLHALAGSRLREEQKAFEGELDMFFKEDLNLPEEEAKEVKLIWEEGET